MDLKENNGTKQITYSAPSSRRKRSWLRRRSRLEMALAAVCLLLVVSCIVLTVVITAGLSATSDSTESHGDHTNQGSEKSQWSKDVCLTTACVKTAGTVLGSMDLKTDPCQDFFQYACGSWNRKNPIPEDKSSYTRFSKLRDEILFLLKGLIETPYTMPTPVSFHKMQTFYQACMDEGRIESRGSQPALTLLKEIGGWPVLNTSWESTGFNYVDLMIKLNELNNKILIEVIVTTDDRNSTLNIVSIDQPSLAMPSRQYYLDPDSSTMREAYRKFATATAIRLGAEPKLAEADMLNVLEFETQLANITVPSEMRRDSQALYNKMTIRDLYTNITDKIDWLYYLKAMFRPSNISLDASELVLIYSPIYVRQMAQLVERTPSRVVANYMVWRFMKHRVNNLGKEFKDLSMAYLKVLYGTAASVPRWKDCILTINTNMAMAIGRMFVQESFDEESKQTALEMISDLRASFRELLEKNEWMNDQAKLTAKEKLDAIQEKIGYPEYILNDTLLDQDMEGLEYNSSLYFENILSIVRFRSRKHLGTLREPVDKSKFIAPPADVNAFYSSSKNQIMFPAAILQAPFYDKNFPKALNYGGIGMVIGHEMTHGFDDRGRQYDKDGVLREWWPPQVVTAFKEKAKCIIDQYSEYTVPEIGMKLNGVKTQGENIADNGGLKQAYLAYQKMRKRMGSQSEPRLPGLNLTHDQLFFLNFAQVFCGHGRTVFILRQVQTDHYPPSKYRVIGTLSNSNEFSKAYKCAQGSRMNPKKKCVVW